MVITDSYPLYEGEPDVTVECPVDLSAGAWQVYDGGGWVAAQTPPAVDGDAARYRSLTLETVWDELTVADPDAAYEYDHVDFRYGLNEPPMARGVLVEYRSDWMTRDRIGMIP